LNVRRGGPFSNVREWEAGWKARKRNRKERKEK
jgi:hypothetical protein